LDTRNFKLGIGRDSKAFNGVTSHMPPVDTEAWFDELWSARYDTSKLTVRDLLLLDMKVAVTEGSKGQGVAFCSMMGTLDGLVAKSGGPEAFVEQVQEFAKRKKFAAVVCFFAEEDPAIHQKGLALVPATRDQQALCDGMEQRLKEAPKNLPQELLRNKLFHEKDGQGVVEHGFGLTGPKLAPLRAFGMRPAISRKTLLPVAKGLFKTEAGSLVDVAHHGDPCDYNAGGTCASGEGAQPPEVSKAALVDVAHPGDGTMTLGPAFAQRAPP